jgi:hypothetical protein
MEKKEMNSMSSNSDYNKRVKKDILCKYGCGDPIKFDVNRVSRNGKKIPLNLDGTAHDCSKRPYNNGIRSCYYCSELITFSNSITAESGKMIPLNPDSSLHDCAKNPFNQTKRGKEKSNL